jgi:hypothetical protein
MLYRTFEVRDPSAVFSEERAVENLVQERKEKEFNEFAQNQPRRHVQERRVCEPTDWTGYVFEWPQWLNHDFPCFDQV